MAWRECESLVERGLVLTKTVPEPTELGDFEVPLPTSVQQDLEQQFLKRYSWLRISSHSVGCDTLLGRVQREFLRRTPTVFRISRVRTRAQSAVSTSAKRQKISDQMSIHFNSGEPEERRISGVLEFLRQLRVLGNTWAMAGNFFVTWQGKEILYCHWGHVTEYITELEGRVLELRHSYTDSSVCSWLAAVEEDFRAKAVELARAPDGPAPWGLALLDAVRELHSKWDQRRDFLVLVGAASRVPPPPGSSGVPRVKREHVPKGPSKGTGKRGRKSDLARPVSPPRDDPLRLNDGTGARGSWKHATMWVESSFAKAGTTSAGAQGSAAVNTGVTLFYPTMSRVDPRTTGAYSTTHAPMVCPLIVLDPQLHTLMFWTKNQDTDAYGVSCHITRATALPPPGEGRAPAAGTIHAPQGDRQAPAVDEGVFARTQGSSASQGEGRALAAGTNHAPPGETLLSPVLPPPVRSADMCMGVDIGPAGSLFIDQPPPVRLATRIILIEICDPCTMLTAAVSQGSVEVFGHFTSAFSLAPLVSAVAPEAVALSSPFELSVVEFAQLSQDFYGCFFVLFAGAQLFEYDGFERGADVFRMASEALFCNSGGMAWSAACLGEASEHSGFEGMPIFDISEELFSPILGSSRWWVPSTLRSAIDMGLRSLASPGSAASILLPGWSVVSDRSIFGSTQEQVVSRHGHFRGLLPLELERLRGFSDGFTAAVRSLQQFSGVPLDEVHMFRVRLLACAPSVFIHPVKATRRAMTGGRQYTQQTGCNVEGLSHRCAACLVELTEGASDGAMCASWNVYVLNDTALFFFKG